MARQRALAERLATDRHEDAVLAEMTATRMQQCLD